jgi:hypothetical protein
VPDLALLRHPSERSHAVEVTAGSLPELHEVFERLTKGVQDAGCAGRYDEGRVACWQTEEANVLGGTDERRRILAIAASRDMQPGELLRRWQLDSGPT